MNSGLSTGDNMAFETWHFSCCIMFLNNKFTLSYFLVLFCPAGFFFFFFLLDSLCHVTCCQDLDKAQEDILKHQASISELKRNFMESTPEPRPNEWEKRRITPLSLQTQGVCHQLFVGFVSHCSCSFCLLILRNQKMSPHKFFCIANNFLKSLSINNVISLT